MGEIHAYGRSLGCVSRRLFVLATASVMAALCFVQLFKWTMSSHLWDIVIGNSWTVGGQTSCSGTQCYEVLSCYGMRGATLHIREPLVSLSGALLLPFGVVGAHQGYRPQLHVFAAYLAASAALHLGLLLGDTVYLQTCGQYPSNVIYQTMINWLPPSPVTVAAQAELLNLDTYSFQKVDHITQGFQVLVWYYALAGSLTVFLAYAASQAHWLGNLVERGPLGLGVHYGLGQWDEILNHDAVRRHKERGLRSNFIDDAKLGSGGGENSSFGKYGAPSGGYGAMGEVEVLYREDGPGDEGDEVDEEAAAAAAAAAAAEEEEEYAAEQERQRALGAVY